MDDQVNIQKQQQYIVEALDFTYLTIHILTLPRVPEETKKNAVQISFNKAALALSPEEINRISQLKTDPISQLNELINALTKALKKLFTSGGNMPNIEKLVNEYEAAQENKDDKRKNKPTLEEPTPHQRVLSSIKILLTKYQNNPNVSNVIIQNSNDIISITTQDPQLLENFLSDPPRYINTLTTTLLPIAKKVILTPDKENLQQLPITNLATTLASLTTPQIVQSLVLYKTLYPESKKADIENFLKSDELAAKVDSLSSSTTAEKVSQNYLLATLVESHNINATGTELVQQTIFSHLRNSTQSSVSNEILQKAAVILTNISPIVYGLSSITTTTTSGEKTLNQAQKVDAVGNFAVEFVFASLGIPTANSFKTKGSAFTWSRINTSLQKLHGSNISLFFTQLLQSKLNETQLEFIKALYSPQLTQLVSVINPQLPQIIESSKSQVTKSLPNITTTKKPSTQTSQIITTKQWSERLSLKRVGYFASEPKRKTIASGALVGGTVGIGSLILGVPLTQAIAYGFASGGITSYIFANGTTAAAAKTSQAAQQLIITTQATIAAIGTGCATIVGIFTITAAIIPIILALLLFIINNSALVVPPNNTSGPGSTSDLVPGPGGGSYPFCWPLSTANNYVSGYWPNTPGTYHTGTGKNSIDLGGGGIGEKIYSTHDGDVNYAGWSDNGYGYNVIIVSKNGIRTIYAHLSEINVTVGQKDLKAGTQIGLMGSTGNSNGPHLHYDIQPSTLIVKYYLPFGLTCERYRENQTAGGPQIQGCEASINGAVNEEPKGCHN